MKEFYLDSCGGGRLHCAIWTPEGEPKAVVQLIHGIAEHIGRYDEFARFLNAHGYVVAADDHMGHGGSVENGVKGYFSGGWLSAVEDEKRLHDEMQKQYPELPYYFLGHSMGSFLLRTYLYTYPDARRGRAQLLLCLGALPGVPAVRGRHDRTDRMSVPIMGHTSNIKL